MEAGEQSSATFQVLRKGTHIMGFHILPNYTLPVKEMKDFLRQTQIEVFCLDLLVTVLKARI